jgi:hypothetical protein
VVFLLAILLATAHPCLSGSLEAAWLHWKLTGPLGGSISALFPDRNQPDVWFALKGSTLYRSSDGANSWVKVLASASTVAVNPKTSEALVSGWSYPGGSQLFSISKDGKLVRRILKGRYLRDVTWSPDGSSRVYASDGSEFCASSDGGRTWETLHKFKGQHIHGFVISPFDSNTIYLTMGWWLDRWRDTTSVTKDGGRSWSKVGHVISFISPWDPAAPQEIFGLQQDHVVQLTRAGWKYFVKHFPSYDIAFDPSNPNHIFALAPVAAGFEASIPRLVLIFQTPACR